MLAMRARRQDIDRVCPPQASRCKLVSRSVTGRAALGARQAGVGDPSGQIGDGPRWGHDRAELVTRRTELGHYGPRWGPVAPNWGPVGPRREPGGLDGPSV